MAAHSHETIGTALYGLRQERGLGVRESARLAGTTKRSIQDWETGRYVPSGASLDRVLKALEAPTALRSRLLAQTAPRYARVALADTPLGAPVDVGQVLRAMRLRQGTTQIEVARALGTTQATLARWEAGDSEPPAETLHEALFALGASPEEALALVTVERRDAAEGMPNDSLEALGRATQAPLALRDVLLLGVESACWWRAARDPAMEWVLCNVVAARAHQCLLRGAIDEVDGHVRRALRMARSVERADVAAGAVYAGCWVRRQTREGALGAARALERWSERMKVDEHRQWLRSAQGFAIVQFGEVSAGIAHLRKLEREALERNPGDIAFYRVNLVEAHLFANQPELAAETFERLGPAGSMITAKALLAQGKEPPAEVMAGARVHGTTSWGAGREAAQVERGLDRVRRGGKARFR